MRGLGWLRAIRGSGTEVLWRHAVVEVEGNPDVRAVVVAPVDERWQPRLDRARRIPADALALGHGLVPAVDVTRLLGARHRYRPDVGGWVPELDTELRTSVKGLYAAGDMAGVAGASAAELRGRLAGLAAARDLGRIDDETHARLGHRLHADLTRAELFGSAVSEQMQIRPGLLDTITSATIVCRCEDITRAEIEHALDQGARTLNDVKAMTRCGMGPCQGRMCGEAAAELVALRVGSRGAAGSWSPRPPLRPVPFDVLTGEYDYGDIVLQAPAPA
jgi:bacterioferritin-associated ferredoxin